MVLIELIGSISLATSLISIVVLVLIHTKKKQDDSAAARDLPAELRTSQLERSSLSVPFEEFNKDISIVHVIQQNEISSSPRKYGIEWILPPTKTDPSLMPTKPSASHLLKTIEFDQGDSLSFSDPTTSVKDLIEKFEKKRQKSAGKVTSRDIIRGGKEKQNPTDSDLTSIETNFDSQTIKIDLNQNQQKISRHSSVSHLDITVPSNLSSSIDLDKFECFSMTSNLSEFLNH